MKKLLLSVLLVLTCVSAVLASGHVATAVGVNPTCSGLCNGSAMASASGGVGPYGYTWTGPSSYSATGQNISGLCAGTYIVTAIDSSDMSTALYTLVITQPSVMTTTVNSPTICSGSSVILTSSTTGGTPGYTYSWSPVTSLSSSTISNPSANPAVTTTYTVTVTDTHGCTTTATSTVTVMSLPVVTVNSPTICAGGTGILVASGATTYLWSTGATADPLAVSPLITTTYTVTGTSGGCVGTAVGTVTVHSAPAVSIAAHNTSCGLCNGSITNTTTGAMTYSWVGTGAYSSTIMNPTGLCTGSYTLTATSASGCTASGFVNITSSPAPSVTISSVVNATCGLCNGSATAVVTGGAGPYTYLWTPTGVTSPTGTGICAGSYTVQVTDAMGCNAFATTIITNSSAITNLNVSTTSTSCGGSTGTVTIGAVTGGTAPYTYSFNGGAFSSTLTYTGLSGGAYNVTVKDASGCMYTTAAIVANSSGVTAAAVSTVNAGCSVSIGEINIGAITGGIAPYTFSLDGSAYTSATHYTGLAAGSHTVIVQDSAGCLFTQSVTIITTVHPTITTDHVQNISCSGSIPGNIQVSVSGGTPGYTYSWSPGTASTQDLTNITSPGGYALTVQDSLGCTALQTFYVGNAPSLYGTVTSTNGNCGTLGTATAIGTGGTAPYTYLWNSAPVQTTATATGLISAHYTCLITDSLGCSTAVNAYINNSCYNIIKGNVYNDINSNCIKDAGEAGYGSITVIASGPMGNFYGYTDMFGNYTILSLNMNNVVTASSYIAPYYVPTCPVSGSINVNFSTPGDTLSNNDFGFNLNPSYVDLVIHPGWSAGSPGFTKQYWICYYNNSTTPQNAVINFIYDPALQYVNSTMGGVHDSINHKITWTYTALAPASFWTWADRPIINFNVPATVSTSTLLHSYFEITPIAGDVYPYNNTLTSNESVTGCHDPNSKMVMPQGTGPYGDIFQSDSILTYTIHFQNNGNDTAHFVEVTDTLSQFLDPATVVPGASTHPYTFSLSGEGTMSFRFDNIMLPDSTTDEPASNGYFTYTVKVKTGTPIGSVINNTADIYFDYNQPVITNTTTNRIVDFTMGIETATTNNAVKVYPNPFTDNTTFVIESDKLNETYSFELADVLGKKVRSMSGISEKQFQVSRSGLQNGIYFYKIYSSESIVGIGKLIIK
ncbi:MAG: DUF7619 domain-containing protein [Bacteroidia bacterium]